MSDEQELTTANELRLNVSNPKERELLVLERENAIMQRVFELEQRKAKIWASSNVVPKQYQGSTANCFIAMEMSQRMGVGLMEVMQNLYIVHGSPAFSAKYLIGLVNKSKVISGRLKFDFVGREGTKERGCRAWAKCAQTGERLDGALITLKMADAEGWSKRQGSKWLTMPEQMLMYRAAAFWARVYAPDATMGMYTDQEIEDTQEKEVNPRPSLSSVLEEPEEEELQIVDVEEEIDELILDYRSGMDDCQTQEQLNGLAKIIADDDTISEQSKRELRGYFQIRQREMRNEEGKS